MSLILSKIIYADISTNGITIFTGIIGLRKTNHIEWKDIEYVAIVEKELISYGIRTYSGLGLLEMPVKVLLFHLKCPLSENELSNINKLSTKYEPNLHHIRASDDGFGIWLTKPPSGGFEPLLYEISKHVNVKSLVKSRPKRFQAAILDVIIFGLVSSLFYLVITNKVILW